MRRVSIDIRDGVPSPEGYWLLFPRPFDDWYQRLVDVEVSGIVDMREIGAVNSDQRAWLVRVEGELAPKIQYRFSPVQRDAADWVWHVPENRYTRASDELIGLAAELAQSSVSQADIVRKLILNAAELFGYEHPEERFNDGHDSVPTICGTTKGSCVDINTYLLAAARSLKIPVQYLAGYWFHPDKTETLDMHCWLVFRCDGEVLFWDLAHHLKWGVDELNPGLNPAGGRRVPMSCGRGLRFDTPHGEIEISHFSEPVWVQPDGTTRRPELRIRLSESEGATALSIKGGSFDCNASAH